MDFLEHEIEEILNIFREESEEQLQKLNKNLLSLESNPKDHTAISELFREAHSLKGSARMIGLDDIQSIAHKLEDVFGQAKEGYMEVNAETVDVMCKAVDCISSIVNESIKTRGKVESPEIKEILAMLDNIITPSASANKKETDQGNAVFEEESEENMRRIPEEIEVKNIIIHINVNIEKLKVFSTSTDALEEFLFFINKLAKAIASYENKRLQGLIDDIKIKVDTALNGSGILVYDEVLEIEETFENFLNLYERLTYNKDKDYTAENKPAYADQEIRKSIIQENIQLQEKEKKVEQKKPLQEEKPAEKKVAEDKQPIPDPAAEKSSEPEPPIKDKETTAASEAKNNQGTDSGFIQPETDFKGDDYQNNNEINYIKKNINVFSNHTEDNAAKFEDIILKLNSLTATINEDQIRQILEKISDLLSFSKDKEAPINHDMVVVLEESFDAAIKMLNHSDEDIKEDPSLILQRITVLHQMLKLAVSQEASAPGKENDEYSGTAAGSAEEQRMKYSPVRRNMDSYPRNQKAGEDKAKQFDLKFGDSNTIKTLRVDTQKLDHLVNQTGELIIAKIKAKEHLSDIEKMIRYIEEWHREWNKTKQYFRYANKHYKQPDSNLSTMQYSPNKSINTFFEENSSKLLSLMNKMSSLYKIVQEDDARLNLIVSGLEEKIKSVRVLPLATIFHLFPRMVRDIARDRNKEVEFFITGSETSVDKKIIEEIKSPLMHIIRNSIDHGLETPSQRVEKSKNPTGKILLAAYHLENSVLIEITDDGKGIDIDTIKKKVLQKELLTREELEAMSEEQIMNIIFWPGFSTGETVTDISGRGIGLDIVHTKISQLNGSIKVKSTIGQGCQVSIQIPVTMATINSFLVETNRQTFAIPTNSIKTTLLIDEDQVFYKEGERTILVDDRTVSICPLSDVLELPENPVKSDKLVIIIVQAEDAQVGFVVDKLIGDHEILHKNLSPPLLRVRNVAGITTLGSGDLCLILNVNDLVKSAYMKFGKTSTKPPAITSIQTETDIRKKNVLVVDDSATTRILQRNILKSSGYNVDAAINGFDALTKIVSNQYDFIVTDAEMPEMDGFELTERLRHDDKYRDIPIIIVTSLTSEEDRMKGLNAGANAYITKGEFDQEELIRTIKRLTE